MSGLTRNYDYRGDPCGELGEAVREVARLREAIRRLAEQDATLSVCDGSVTVTMDATLTDAEREAIKSAVYLCGATAGLADENANAHAWAQCAATLRGLLERHGAGRPARSGEKGGDTPRR